MSWQKSVLVWALRRWIKPYSRQNQDIATTRAMVSRVPFGPRLRRGWRIRNAEAGGPNGEWIEPVAPDARARARCILYLHGGAYVAMSPRTHRAITSRLACQSDTMLFALDYRLAPEHPFPAALDDARAAYLALLARGVPASRLVIAGDSAGGGLALALLVALREEKQPLPAAAVLLSPWTDLSASGESITANSDSDALLFGTWVAAEARYYLAGTPATHPLASPVFADLTGLPPLFIQVSDSEILLDDSRRVHQNAQRAAVAATLQVWHALPHGWHIFAPILPEARAALRDAASFIRETLR